ncbi:unnamed protein product [Ixodes hexagonus]
MRTPGVHVTRSSPSLFPVMWSPRHARTTPRVDSAPGKTNSAKAHALASTGPATTSTTATTLAVTAAAPLSPVGTARHGTSYAAATREKVTLTFSLQLHAVTPRPLAKFTRVWLTVTPRTSRSTPAPKSLPYPRLFQASLYNFNRQKASSRDLEATC